MPIVQTTWHVCSVTCMHTSCTTPPPPPSICVVQHVCMHTSAHRSPSSLPTHGARSSRTMRTHTRTVLGRRASRTVLGRRASRTMLGRRACLHETTPRACKHEAHSMSHASCKHEGLTVDQQSGSLLARSERGSQPPSPSYIRDALREGSNAEFTRD